MRNICFVSDSYNDLFPSNTSTQFHSSVQLSLLEYLTPFSENIEFCIKTISFYLEDPLPKAGVFGLRSSLARDSIIRGSSRDSIVTLFTIERTNNPTEVKISINNKIFLLTTKQRISEAYFEIINLETNRIIPSSNIRSSVIEVFVKSSRLNRMRPPFTMLLQSNDVKSKETYPENTNMKFSIVLVERMEFSLNWTVVLKGLSMTSGIFNVQDDTFSVSFVDYTHQDDSPLSGLSRSSNETPFIFKSFTLPPGLYSTEEEMFSPLNEWMKRENIKLNFIFSVNRKRVQLMRTDKVQYAPNRRVELKLSRNLSIALGFYNREAFLFDVTARGSYLCPSAGNLNIGTPTNIILKCDIIATTAVGNRKVKMLRHITNFNNQFKKSIMNFQYRDPDPCEIEIKTFSKISFEFCTIEDKPILALNDQASYLHMLFVNI